MCPPRKICVDLIASYECRCPPGYTGDDCTIKTNPCFTNPCSNGGTCSVNPNTFEFNCSCPPGFTGLTCEEDIDECGLTRNANICNHGICVNNQGGGFQCYCTPGFTGERCDLDFDECLSMPCKNNARCINKVNNYECICTPGYTGIIYIFFIKFFMHTYIFFFKEKTVPLILMNAIQIHV